MEVTEELYNYLVDSQVISEGILDRGIWVLDESTSSDFENGLNFTPLLKRLCQLANQAERLQTPMPEINSLKKVNSASARLFNWNILVQALQMFEIDVDQDTKSLIVAGDRDLVIDVLNQIRKREQDYQQYPQEDDDFSEMASSQPKRETRERKQTIIGPDGSLHIDTLETDIELSETSACLEFLLVSFCKNFELNPKQSAGLLTQGNKYLAHIIAKGIKGQFDKIIAWYQDIHSNVKHLVRLIEKEEANDSMNLMLTAFRPGFFSRAVEVAQWCCRVFSKLGQEFGNNDMIPQSWDWFTKDFGGIDACILSIQKFGPEIRSLVVSVFTQFATNNFLELFSLHIRNAFPEPAAYLMIINEFLSNLSEIKTAKQEISDGGVIDYWLDFGLREADNTMKKSLATRQAALSLLIELWIHFPAKIEEREEIASNILTCLKRGARDKSRLLNLSSIGSLFYLLDIFSAERNPYAPIIYKTLTFSVVENHQNSELREFLLRNFVNLFDKVQSIPVGVLLEPLIKQILVGDTAAYQFNIFDFELFSSAARHPRLTLKNAIQLLDVLGKIYLNDLAFSRASGIPFMLIVARYGEDENMVEYIERFVKFSLRSIIEIEKARKPIQPEKAKYLNQPVGKVSETVRQTDLVQRQMRDNVLDMITRIIKLQDEELNEKIKDMLISGHRQCKKALGGQNYKPFIIVLDLFGDGASMVFDQTSPKASRKNSNPRNGNVNRSVNMSPDRVKSRIRDTTPQPNARVQQDIDRHFQNAKKKQAQALLEEEKAEAALEKQKRMVRKQLEKRKVQLGVVTSSADLIMKDVGHVPVKGAKEEIVIRDLEEEMAEDRESVNIVLKRYQWLLNNLFKKYQGTGYSQNKQVKGSFEALAKKHVTMNEAEFFRLLKEHGVEPSMLSKSEFSAIMKKYNLKQGVADLLAVDQLRFLGLFTQVALFIYSRDPHDLSHLPPGIAVKALIKHFSATVSKQPGPTPYMYTNPDPGSGDKDVIKSLNAALRENPDTPMPEGYRRILEKDIDIQYVVPDTIQAPQAYVTCLEILDEAMSKRLSMHILEPQITQISYYRAKGVKIKSQVPSKVQADFTRQPSVQELSQKTHKLTPALKVLVAKLSPEDKEVGMECAIALNDIIHSVELGSKQALVGPDSGLNRLQRIRKQEEEIEKINKEEAEIKRLLRRQKMQEEMAQMHAEKAAVDEERFRQQQKEEEINKKRDATRARRRERERTEKAAQIAEWKEQKERYAEPSVTGSSNVGGNKKFLKEQRQKIEKQNAELAAKREEEQKAQEKAELVQKVKKGAFMRSMTKKREDVTAKQAKEEQKKKDINTLYNKMGMQAIVQNHSKLIDTLYKWYAGESGYSNDEDTGEGYLQYKSFHKFTAQFNIFPGLMTSEDVNSIFKSFTKEKTQPFLNFEDFKQALLRISVKGQQKLNLASGRGTLQFDINLFPPEGFEALFEWLSISDEPKEALVKLRDMKTTDLKSRKREATIRAEVNA